MDYNLAKQLKDAGFPQMGKSERGDWYFLHKLGEWKQYWTNLNDYPEGTYAPSLEELIAACGHVDLQVRTNKSKAAQIGKKAMTVIHGIGKTPTEAVANLYLALHKK